jgi:hypothetical protein
MSAPARHSHDRRDNFDALLLADKVLSQETAPSTPRGSGAHGQHSRVGGVARHTRSSHSISSLPATPERRIAPRVLMNVASVLDSTETAAGRAPSRPLPPPPFPLGSAPHMVHRRASSDSTISLHGDDAAAAAAAAAAAGRASLRATARDDDDDDDDEVGGNDEIPESEASQAATSMLRSVTTPKRAQGHAADQSAKQTRIVGRATKPTAEGPDAKGASPEKRRMVSGVVGADLGHGPGLSGSPKKRRLEGVGLGIGV